MGMCVLFWMEYSSKVALIKSLLSSDQKKVRTSVQSIWEENIRKSGKSCRKAMHVDACVVGLRHYKEGDLAWVQGARRTVAGLMEVGICHAGVAADH